MTHAYTYNHDKLLQIVEQLKSEQPLNHITKTLLSGIYGGGNIQTDKHLMFVDFVNTGELTIEGSSEVSGQIILTPGATLVLKPEVTQKHFGVIEVSWIRIAQVRFGLLVEPPIPMEDNRIEASSLYAAKVSDF